MLTRDSLRMAMVPFAAEMAIWIPYRYLGSRLGMSQRLLEDPAISLIDSALKLLLIGLIVAAFVRRYGLELGSVGIRAKPPKAIAIGTSILSIAYLSTFELLSDVEAIRPATVIAMLLVGVSEEALFRGYIYGVLRSGARGIPGILLSIVLSSLAFSVAHLPIYVWFWEMGVRSISIALLSAFAFGVAMCLAMEAFGLSVIVPATLHWLHNTLVSIYRPSLAPLISYALVALISAAAILIRRASSAGHPSPG